MVQFPRGSEVLVFDLEAYVPEEDRGRRRGASLAVNPFRPGHALLGGVFYGVRPQTGEVWTSPEFEHHWMWDEGGEEETVCSVYEIFAGMRRRAGGKRLSDADPVAAGVGISMFDMPFLLAKFLSFAVAPPEDVYEALGKVRVIDLAVAGIGFVPTGWPELYPRPHNVLADALLPEREEKPTGKVVWDMVDAGEYAGVAKRCEGEVREMAEMAERMLRGKEGS
ncbi:MAG: hypothetical protein Q4Q04_06080 [Methanocorpusculum sp.]|nr:hypothetical protein [Methanocorpusculum sp.]